MDHRERNSPFLIVSNTAASDARSLSTLILGFRFFALAAVAGTAGFLPPPHRSVSLIVAGVLLATALAWLQNLALPRRRALAALFPWLHVGAWTVLIHATGGPRSPVVLGYLLEMPLSGALLGTWGVVMVALASVTLHALDAAVLAPPIVAGREIAFATVVAMCAAITWWVVTMIERRNAENERSRARLADHAHALGEDLRLLGHSLDDALVSIDRRGRIEGLNPAGASLLGIEPSRAIGRAWQDVLGVDAASRSRLAETTDTGIAHHGVPMVLSNGSAAPVGVRAHIWRGPGSDSTVHLLLDPGKRPAMDDPLRRLGESAACVAHQIKNSMHCIQGYVGTATAGSTSLPSDECIGALQGLSALAEDVLAMAGAQAARTERVAIQDVLRSALVLLSQPRVRLDLPTCPVYVQVHRSQLVHAVFNLLDNALRVSPPDESVDVRVERQDARVVVEIADAGPGIPEEARAASGPAPSKHGSGWGLVAARRFVSACGGELSLTAREGGGTRCRMELPSVPVAALQGGMPR